MAAGKGRHELMEFVGVAGKEEGGRQGSLEQSGEVNPCCKSQKTKRNKLKSK